jgi:S-adenosylmethionine decarboxylase
VRNAQKEARTADTGVFGYELLIDLYSCAAGLAEDLAVAYGFLDDLTTLLGMHKQAPPFVFVSPPEFPDKAGLSGWVPLIESGIQIHTLTADRFVSVDVYSCRPFDRSCVLDFCRERYRPADLDEQLVLRGVRFPGPTSEDRAEVDPGRRLGTTAPSTGV